MLRVKLMESLRVIEEASYVTDINFIYTTLAYPHSNKSLGQVLQIFVLAHHPVLVYFLLHCALYYLFCPIVARLPLHYSQLASIRRLLLMVVLPG